MYEEKSGLVVMMEGLEMLLASFQSDCIASIYIPLIL